MIRERILFRLFFSLLLLLSFSPFCTYELTFQIHPNLDSIRSRRDYNRYELAYSSVLDRLSDTVETEVLLETSFTEISFPTVLLPVHSYIGDLFMEEAPDVISQYNLDPFSMKVQGLDRTLIDKVFAICDYYLNNNVTKHSRHIYDIYKLTPSPKNGHKAG